jgi:aspartate aminotransferase-like enzyme
MTASGTGGLEAAVANLLSPGEPALFCVMGWFGELWTRIATAFGVDVVRVDAPWGEAIGADAVAAALDANGAIRTVFVTHIETSTGVRNDLASLARVVKQRGCLLAIDSVSGAPGEPLDVEALDADVVVLGSQKGWLAPPGLAMAIVSPSALRTSERATCPRYFFDFHLCRTQQQRGLTNTTPPLPAMQGLRAGLALLQTEGQAAVWARHERVAATLRHGLGALGLELIGRERSLGNTVTAVASPFDAPDDLAALVSSLRGKHGTVIAEGVGPTYGRVFRIGHVGVITEAEVSVLLDRLEEALAAATSEEWTALPSAVA